MLRTALLIAVGAFALGLGSNALSIAQNLSNFEKKNFNYNEELSLNLGDDRGQAAAA